MKRSTSAGAPALILVPILASLLTPSLAGAAAWGVDVRPSAVAPGRLETTVRYADVDLRRASGAAKMLSRIETAADAVCGGLRSAREPQRSKVYHACRAETVARAVARLNAPLVTALHTGQGVSALAAN